MRVTLDNLDEFDAECARFDKSHPQPRHLVVGTLRIGRALCRRRSEGTWLKGETSLRYVLDDIECRACLTALRRLILSHLEG